jgi:hypothetical protein
MENPRSPWKVDCIAQGERWLLNFLATRRIFLWIGSRIPNKWDKICTGTSNDEIASFGKYELKTTKVLAFQNSIVQKLYRRSRVLHQ